MSGYYKVGGGGTSGGGGYSRMAEQNMVAIIQDPELAIKYPTLIDLVNTYELDIEIPEFVLIGTQSGGKSSVLSQLLGRCVSFIKGGVGTRCPVRYILRNRPDLFQPETKFNGETIPLLENLMYSLAELMEQIKDETESGVSADVATVEISSRELPNMVLTDLPGLAPNDEDLCDLIEDIVRPYFLSPNTVPIVVRKPAETQIHGTTIVELLDEMAQDGRPGWKDNSIFVVTAFDLTSKNLTEVEKSMEWFQEMRDQADTGNLVVVSLNPNNKDINGIIDAMQRNAFVKNVPKLEATFFNNYFRDVSLPSEIKRQCGIPVMIRLLGQKVDKVVKTYAPKVKKLMSAKMRELRDQIERARKAKEVCNPTELRKQLSEFSTKFRHWTKLYNMSHYSVRKKFPLNECGLNWDDEVEEFKNSTDYTSAAQEWDNFQEFYTLAENLKANGMDELLGKAGRKATGLVAVERALSIWVFMVTSTPFPEFSEDDIWDAARPMHASNKADFACGVRNITALALQDVGCASRWLSAYLRFLFRRSGKLVFSRLMNREYAHLKAYTHLLERNSYTDIVSRLIDDLEETTLNELEDMVAILKEDLANKFLETASKFNKDEYENEEDEYSENKSKWQAKAQNMLSPLGYFSKATNLTESARSMLGNGDRRAVPDNDTTFCENVLRDAFEHYRVLKFILMEVIYTKAQTRVINKVCEESRDNYVEGTSVVGVKDREAENLTRQLASMYGIEDISRLAEWLEQNGAREKGFMSMTDEQLLAAAGLEPGQLERDFQESQHEYQNFMQEYEKARSMF